MQEEALLAPSNAVVHAVASWYIHFSPPKCSIASRNNVSPLSAGQHGTKNNTSKNGKLSGWLLANAAES